MKKASTFSNNSIFLRSNEFQEVRKVFARSSRVPNLYFVSSNTAKICHMQHIFALFRLPLKVYKQVLQTYKEDHNLSPNSAIKQSILDVSCTLKRLGLFFIEDSSFILDVLSSSDNEVPGLATKRFVKKYPFSELDKLLRSRGNNRRAKLVSRIGLHLPGGFGTEVFTGAVEGHIAVEYTPSALVSGIPWLDEKSPANYFIPDGFEKPLSQIALEISYNFDTRLKAIHQMLFRLAQFATLADFSNISFLKRKQPLRERQLRLFSPAVLLVSAYSGSGKTTTAIYLSRKHQMNYFEQSDTVRAAAYESNWLSDDLAPFCNRIVSKHGPLYFILYFLETNKAVIDAPFIISGLRNPNEVDYLRELFPKSKLIYLDTPFELRYARRSLGGFPHPQDKKGFEQLTQQEKDWGTELIRNRADFVISNTGNLEKLYYDLNRLSM